MSEFLAQACEVNEKRITRLEEVVEQLSTELAKPPRRNSTKSPRTRK